MADVVAHAVVEVTTDDSKVVAGAKAAGEKGGKAAGGGFSGAFKGAMSGVAATAAASFTIAKAGEFFKSAITGASDLNETISKTGVIFGPASDAIVKFASQGADKLGQTKQEALDAATTFGVFGKAAGLQGGKLSKFSTGLVSLSTDLASFHNAAPEEVVNALGSALRGEAEPMRKFGVLMDDASLKAEALAQGLIKPVKNQTAIAAASLKAKDAQAAYNEAVAKNGKNSSEANRAQIGLQVSLGALRKATDGTIGPLTAQQKTLAAQGLIMKQTKDAQGDFARTSDGLANQQRILDSRMKDITATIGQAFLPAVVAIVSAVNDVFNGTSPLSPLFDTLGGILTTVVVPGFLMLVDALSSVVQFVAQNAAWFKIAAAALLLFLAPTIAINIALAAVAVTSAIAGAAVGAWNVIVGIATAVTNAWRLATMLLNAAWLASPIGVVIIALVALAALFVILWKRSDTFRTVVKATWSAIQKAVGAVVSWFSGPFKSFFTKTMPGFFSSAWERAKSIFKTAVKVILAVLFPFPTLAFVIFRRFGPQAIAIFQNAWGHIRDAFAHGVQFIGDQVRKIPGIIGGIASGALSAGKRVGSSIINGIRSGLSSVGGMAGDLAGAIKHAINSTLGLPHTISLGVGKFKASATIPALAGGTTNFAGGFAMVGEKGPELVALPKGSAVFPNGQGPRSVGPTINVHLPTGDPMAAALAVANRLAVL